MLRFFTTHEWFFQYDNLEAVLGAVPARHRYLYDGDITWINWEVRTSSLPRTLPRARSPAFAPVTTNVLELSDPVKRQDDDQQYF